MLMFWLHTSVRTTLWHKWCSVQSLGAAWMASCLSWKTSPEIDVPLYKQPSTNTRLMWNESLFEYTVFVKKVNNNHHFVCEHLEALQEGPKVVIVQIATGVVASDMDTHYSATLFRFTSQFESIACWYIQAFTIQLYQITTVSERVWFM